MIKAFLGNEFILACEANSDSVVSGNSDRKGISLRPANTSCCTIYPVNKWVIQKVYTHLFVAERIVFTYSFWGKSLADDLRY